MALVSLYICDICKADGYLRKAVESYEGDDKQVFHCCKKHRELPNADLSTGTAWDTWTPPSPLKS